MRKIVVFVIAVASLFSCKEKVVVDENYVIAKFKENSSKINSLQYRIQRIDTFAQGGTVWNNTGRAIIEKDKEDKVFGFSFYGKRDDIPKEYIYDSGKGFEISKRDSTYKLREGHYGFLGTPGGQMIPQNIFKLDSIYKKVTLSEKINSYMLTYEFENDTVYNVSDIIKTVELSKENFFPIKIKRTSNFLGNRSAHQVKLSEVKVNSDVKESIKDIKNSLQKFTILKQKKRGKNKLLNAELPKLSLPNLFDENEIVSIEKGKLTLIDFWEVWCGPCIAAFPKVEELKNKYVDRLNIIGIVSEDTKNAIALVKKKKITFLNLVGNKEVEKMFSVNGWPTYFLIDNKGVVQKEYFGFSEQIEEDIKKYIVE